MFTLKALFDYIEGVPSKAPFVRLVDKEVEYIKKNIKWRQDYMKEWIYQYDYIEKGRAEGKFEATMELAKRFLALGNTVDDVARASDLPLDVVQSLVS